MIGLYLFSKTPENGAQTSIFCAVDESLENCTGKYYKDCKEVSPAKQAENMDDAQRLWNATQELLNKENWKYVSRIKFEPMLQIDAE